MVYNKPQFILDFYLDVKALFASCLNLVSLLAIGISEWMNRLFPHSQVGSVEACW